MTASTHLTVRAATELTGKSESTIKRLIREIADQPEHPDRERILPGHAEIERRKAAGEPYVWKIERGLLLERYPEAEEGSEAETQADEGSVSVSMIEVLKAQLESKDQQIRTLETQLDRKDNQIENLSERMRESNVLMNELQKRLAIAAPRSKEVVDGEPVDTAGNETPERKHSFWRRPIRLFDRA